MWYYTVARARGEVVHTPGITSQSPGGGSCTRVMPRVGPRWGRPHRCDRPRWGPPHPDVSPLLRSYLSLRRRRPPLTLPPAFRIGASLPEARRRNVSAPFMCSPCAPYVLASSCAPSSRGNVTSPTDRPPAATLTATRLGAGEWGVMSPPRGSPHSVMPHVGPRWGRPHGCDARGVNDLPPCAGYRIYHIEGE